VKYLLDTCVISDFVKGEENTLHKIKKFSPFDFSISSITVMELNYGLVLNAARAKLIGKIIQDFLSTITILDFNQKDAHQAAVIRAYLKKKGRPIGSYDILLAGTALNHQLTFVTSNVNEFSRIEGLILENWRDNG
jgi:tRNA(fMet)-specific endonuclease VapC